MQGPYIYSLNFVFISHIVLAAHFISQTKKSISSLLLIPLTKTSMASGSAISTIRGKYNAAKISVWWDMQECEVPTGFDVEVVIQNIKTALQKINYCGPVSFSVYGDTTRLPSLARKSLESTDISLCHVPAGIT